jgi:hypothetical protein
MTEIFQLGRVDVSRGAKAALTSAELAIVLIAPIHGFGTLMKKRPHVGITGLREVPVPQANRRKRLRCPRADDGVREISGTA